MSHQGFRTPEPVRPGAEKKTPPSNQRSTGRGRGRGRAIARGQGRAAAATAPQARVGKLKQDAYELQQISHPLDLHQENGPKDGYGQRQCDDYVLVEASSAPTRSLPLQIPPTQSQMSPVQSSSSQENSMNRYHVHGSAPTSQFYGKTQMSAAQTGTFSPTHLPSNTQQLHTLSQNQAIIEVSGISGKINKDLLQLYFESQQDSGGEPNAVKECEFVSSGCAYVIFHQSHVAAQVLSKHHHTLEGAVLILKQLHEIPESRSETVTLLVKHIPTTIDSLHMELTVQGVLSPSQESLVSFSGVENGSCTIHLPPLPSTDIDKCIEKIKGLNESIKIIYHSQNTIKIRNSRQSKTFLRLYFSNERKSGGGELSSDPTILEGETEAIVSFKQPHVLKRVLARCHKEALGEAVQMEVFVPDNEEPIVSQAPSPSVDQAPIKISVDSKIAIAIHTFPTKLEHFVESLSASMELQLDHILVTPSEKSCIGWKEKCEDFLEKTFSKCTITVPNEIRKEMTEKLEECKQNHAFTYKYESDTHEATSYVLAGEIETLQNLQKYNEEIKSYTEEQLDITAEQYDFIDQLNNLADLESKYPTVTIIPHIAGKNYFISLKGPQLYVQQLKQELEKIAQDLKVIPVTGLDQNFIHHFSTIDGRRQIKEFIRLKECPMAVTFHCPTHPLGAAENDVKLSMAFVCKSVNERWASSIPKALVQHAKYEKMQVPELLTSKLDTMKDFAALVSELKTHGSVIILDDPNITVVGFSDSVVSCVRQLESFFTEKITSSSPLTIPVTELVCQAIKKRPKNLEQILAECSTKLSYSFSDDETKILIKSKTLIEGDWKLRCKTSLIHYTSQFNVIQVPISTDSAQGVSKFLTSIEKSSNSPFVFDMQVDPIEIAGIISVVNEDLETKLLDLSYSLTKILVEIPLHPTVHVYISQVKLASMKSKHPELSLTLNSTSLTVSGPRDKITQFEEIFKQNYSKFESVEATTDPAIADFLSDGHGKEFLTTFVKTNKHALVAIFFSNISPQIQSLCFLCDPKDSASTQKLIAELLKKVEVGTTPLPESLKKPKQPLKSKFIEFYKKVENDCHVICFINTLMSKISFTGSSDDVQKAIKLMNDFLAKECTVVKEIQLSSLEWKLMQKDERWTQNINKQFIFNVDRDKNGSKVTIVLKGDEYGVTMTNTALAEMKDSMKTNSITVLAPGACKFFQDETTTSTIISGLEQTYSVCIETITLENIESEVIFDDIVTTLSAREYCRASSKFPNNNIVAFKVYIGDITDFPADVIVNAANGKLKHIGGLAAAILKKGGKEIQSDCDDYIQSRLYKLGDGDVYSSLTTGKLPCKRIVHAVGPRWNTQSTDHKYEKTRLAHAVNNTLRVSRNFRSIAFPAISSGIYDYPINECALVHIEAALYFFRSEKTNLQDVSFIVLHQAHAVAFHNAISHFFPGRVDLFDMETSSIYALPNQPAVSSKTLPGIATQSSTPAVKRLPQLHQGDLFSTKTATDVYVCTANTDLDLSRGIVARAMATLSGPSLQKECNDKGRANIGDVVVTGPGKLDCRYVFHAVATNHSSDRDGKILRNLLKKCFKECEKHPEVNSIMLPAIGSGGLGYPILLVAKIMVSESCAFLSKVKNPSFKLHLVIFDLEQHKAFQTELENATGTPIMKPMTQKISSSSAASPSSYEEVVSSSSAPDFNIQGIQVSIVEGDITKESTDAIINTTSSGIALKASGQVSAAFLKLCGSKLQDLCTTAVQNEGNLTEGKVICTKALKPLKCISLFHIYFNSNDPVKYVQTVKACLLKAEQLQYRSITLPAIGTGAHKYPILDAVKGTLAGIKEFALSNPKTVKLIRIIIYDHAIYDKFATMTMEQLEDTKSTADNSNSFTVYSDSELDEESSEYDSDVKSDSFSDDDDHKCSETSEDNPAQASGFGLSQLTQSLSIFKFWSSDTNKDAKASADSSAVTKETPPTGLKLCICGFNESNVHDATKRLNKLMRENFDDAEINDETIKSLKHEECQEIYKECEGLGVKCTLETDIGRIRLTGNVKDIHKMRSKVQTIIISVMSRKTEEHGEAIKRKYEVETFFQSIHWQYKKPSAIRYDDYDKEVSYAIEQAYQLYLSDKSQCKFSYEKGPYKIVINFQRNEEKDRKTGKTSQVKRFTMSDYGKSPDTWDDMPSESPVFCVDLKPDGIEYNEVLDAFNKSMSKGNNYTDIVRIQRIQNPKLYSLYAQAKEQMDKTNPLNRQNESQLFHGTDYTSAIAINTNGFNRIYAGKHAKAYGVGTYFARDASYSASSTYSQPDSKGQKYIYLARVLVGEYTVGSSSMMVPPAKDPQKDVNVLFDSLVNNTSDPTIFVVGPDAHSYPEYLITFKG